MPMCKFCGVVFSWGHDGERWVPLVPKGEEGTLDRSYQDENGDLRAEHRAICRGTGGPSVRVVRLAKKIEAASLTPTRRWSQPDKDGVIIPEDTGWAPMNPEIAQAFADQREADPGRHDTQRAHMSEDEIDEQLGQSRPNWS